MMLLMRFIRDESGSTSVEYGLVASLVAFVIVSGLRMTGPKLGMDLGKISANL